MSKKKKGVFEVLYEICNSGTAKQKIERMGAFPKMVDIELTNCCNMRCRMCPVGQGNTNRTIGYMDCQLIERILVELSQHKTPIRLIRWGEPLLHPGVYDIIRRAKELDIAVHLNTNGLNLSPPVAKMLISTGIDSIKISMQGYDRQSYARMRGMDFFVQLCEDIRGLVLARGKSEKPWITVGTTMEEITFASKKPDVGKKIAFSEVMEKVVDAVYVGKTLNLAEKRTPPDVCPEVWDKLSIDWDGKVSACCGDYDTFMTIGNLATQTLKEIWVCKKAKTYRRKLAEHDYEGLTLCQHCARGR